MQWKNVNEEFLEWLRNNYEGRIPNTNYGAHSYKPFFGNLFEIGDLVYVTQISSPKPRHNNVKQSLDFYKIYHPNDNAFIAVVNLNYMFPVHKTLLSPLRYADIYKYRNFVSDDEKSKYIDLLRTELKEINNLRLVDASQKIYALKYDKPNHPVSQRSFDFKSLEEACKKYKPSAPKDSLFGESAKA